MVYEFYCLPATLIIHEIKFWWIQTVKKVSFLALSEVLNFNFSKFEPFLKSQIYQTSKLRVRVSEIVKMAIFDNQILPKLFSL